MNEKYINRGETLRYIRYGGEPEGEFLSRLESCERKVANAAVPKYIYRIFETAELESVLRGEDIKKHISGCDRVILFAATLGLEVDRYIRRCEVSDIASAMIADAAASAFIEEYCKEADSVLAKKLAPCYLTWRFSPGYGDFPIELQGEILSLLSAEKRIGLYATESCMLIPAKSVTAVIGMSDFPVTKEKQNCALCLMRDKCAFRKEGEHCGCQRASE